MNLSDAFFSCSFLERRGLGRNEETSAMLNTQDSNCEPLISSLMIHLWGKPSFLYSKPLQTGILFSVYPLTHKSFGAMTLAWPDDPGIGCMTDMHEWACCRQMLTFSHHKDTCPCWLLHLGLDPIPRLWSCHAVGKHRKKHLAVPSVDQRNSSSLA